MTNNKDDPNFMERITSDNTITIYSSDDIPTTDHEVHKVTRANVLEALPPDCTVEINEFDVEEFNSIEPTVGRDSFTKREEPVTMEMSDSVVDQDDLYERVRLLADVLKKGLYDYRHLDEPLDSAQDCHNKERVVNEEGVASYDTPTKVSPEDLEKLEKLRKAIAKMRRLDKKLAEVMKKEREVKQRRNSSRDHTLLQDDIFRDNIFKTQPIEGSRSEDLRVECVEEDQPDSDPTEIETEFGSEKNQTLGQRSKENNFIERNKELASEKGDVVMTEGEKKRLEELLMEEEEEEQKEGSTDSDNRVYLSKGFGFTHEEMSKLEEIDRALENVISISKAPSVLSNITDNGCGPGEEVLALLQATRTEQQRMKEINHLLASLKEFEFNKGGSPNDDDAVKISISDEQLAMLLQQYQVESET